MLSGCQNWRANVYWPLKLQFGSLQCAGLYVKISNLQTGVARAPLSGLHVCVGLRRDTVLLDTLSSCSHAAEGGSGRSSAVVQLQMRVFATFKEPAATARG